MRRILLTLSVLALGVLACGQIVTTPSPTSAPYNTDPLIIATAKQLPSPTAASTPWVAVVRQFRVYLHKAPGGEVYTDRWLVAGQRVEIVEIRGDWVRVAGPGGGWAFAGCLEGIDSEKGCEAK
mgnify:CR=1 FL=1